MSGLDNLRDDMAALETGQPLSFKEHLVNSLVTSSGHAALIRDALEGALADQPREGRSRLKRALMNAIRVTETMRVTHRQLAHLVRGEDLDTRDLRREREAEIYTRFKEIDRLLVLGHTNLARTELASTLEYIREDSDVN